MEAKAEILKQMQSTYKAIFTAHEKWEILHKECIKPIKRLVNFGEQYSFCANSDFQLTPLSEFSDIQTRLLSKLAVCLHNELAQIQNNIHELKLLKEEVETSILKSTKTYNKYHKQISVQQVCEHSALRPSIARMLENLQSINHAFHIEYTRKLNYVTAVEYESLDSMENLLNEWNKSDLDLRIRDKLAITTHFMKTDEGHT